MKRILPALIIVFTALNAYSKPPQVIEPPNIERVILRPIDSTNFQINPEIFNPDNIQLYESPCDSGYKLKYVSDYGAIGDGITNDTDAIQAALNDGDGIVVLMEKHLLGLGTVENHNCNFITYFGAGKSELIGRNTRKIDNYANLKITNVKSNNGGFVRLAGGSYDLLEVSNCEVNNDTLRPIIYVDNGIHPVITSIKISNNLFTNNVSIAFLDRVQSKKIVFSYNFIEDFVNYALRVQFGNGPSKVEKIVFDHNYIDRNIQKANTETRIVQILAKESIHYTNNVIRNISNTEKNVSLLYTSHGTLFMSDNYFENISGYQAHLVQDKSNLSNLWNIHDNIFDQRLVVDSFDPLNPLDRANHGNQSIVNIINNQAIISNNLFLNPKCTSIVIGNSVFDEVGDPFAQNCLVSNNSFINVENPSTITLIQGAEDITIQGNIIDKVSNPLGKPVNNVASTRFISFLSSSNEALVKNIIIKNNTVNSIDPNGTLLWSFSRSVSRGVEDIKLLNNYMNSGEALIRLNTEPIRSGEIFFNILPTGATDLFVGPPDPGLNNFRISNNVLD